MNDYLYAWITVAVLAAIAELLAPGGKSGKLTGYLRFLAGLCILLAFLPTIKEGVKLLTNMKDGDLDTWLSGSDMTEDYEACFNESLCGLTREQCEGWIYDTLRTEFSINREDCLAQVTVVESEDGIPSVTKVSIVLSGRAVAKDPFPIRNRMSSAFSAPCEVAVDVHYFTHNSP